MKGAILNAPRLVQAGERQNNEMSSSALFMPAFE